MMMEKRLIGSFYGSTRPRIDMPRLVDLYMEKKIKIEHFGANDWRIKEVSTDSEFLTAAVNETSRRNGRVVYELAEPAPLVSIVIPMRDRVDLIERCVASIREQTDYPSIEFVVVDNGSIEAATLKFLHVMEQEMAAQIVWDDGPFNFSRLINRGAAAAKGDVLAFLNNDIETSERGWLREMVSHVVQPGVGAVGARLWYPDGTLQHGGVIERGNVSFSIPNTDAGQSLVLAPDRREF
jgi:hypothetical protein